MLAGQNFRLRGDGFWWAIITALALKWWLDALSESLNRQMGFHPVGDRPLGSGAMSLCLGFNLIISSIKH
jgi:hypothetical protein